MSAVPARTAAQRPQTAADPRDPRDPTQATDQPTPGRLVRAYDYTDE